MLVHARRSVQLCLVVLVLSTAWFVSRPDPVSPWVRVEAAPYATLAHPMRLNARVAPQPAPAYIVADLHWSSPRREPRGFLVGGSAHPVGIEGGAFAFEYLVPDRNDLGYVHAVFYLSPTNRWEDRIRWAVTDPIPFLRAEATQDARAEPWPVRDYPSGGAESRRSPSLTATWLTTLVWLAAAIGCVRLSRIAGIGAPASLTASRHLLLTAVACVMAALWESIGAATVLGSEGRRWAFDERLYYERATLQKIVTVLFVAAAAFAVAWILPRTRNAGHQAVLLGLISFGAAAGVDVLSLHAIDELFSAAWWGIPAIQWVQFAASVVALGGIVVDGLFTQGTPG